MILGEGARALGDRPLRELVQILDEYRGMLAANPVFEPVRRPCSRPARSGGQDVSLLIGDRVTSRCTDLFNVGYEILLQIQRYFAHTEEEPDAARDGERGRHHHGRRAQAAR